MSSVLEKMERLSGEPAFAPKAESLKKLGGVLSQLSSEGIVQIYPLSFSAKYEFDLVFLLDVLIFGTKLGLFEIFFRQICPGCGGAEFTVPTLEKLSSLGNHCTICNIKIDVALDEQVEVVFGLNRELQGVRSNYYQTPEIFRNYFFSPSLERSPELLKYSKERLVRVEVLPPNASTQITFTPSAHAKLYRLLSVKNHSQVSLPIDKGKGSRRIEVEVRENGFSIDSGIISDKEVTLCVVNGTSEFYPITVIKTDFDVLHKVLKEHPNVMRRFFSAKDLINLQRFRDVFKFETLSPDFCLPIRNLTVLFTDIKGSTQLYEEKGDSLAYALVRKHLAHLTEQTRKQMGCIVKTLGDSVMATFSTPKDAIKAALGMQEMANLNSGARDESLGLKIGIHEGEVLVVNAESKLDFFGQTINLAARLKDQAKSGEICMTSRVLENAAVKEALRDRHWITESFESRVKGLAGTLKLERAYLRKNGQKKVA